MSYASRSSTRCISKHGDTFKSLLTKKGLLIAVIKELCTYVDEVDKVCVLRIDQVRQALGAGHAHLPLAVGHDDRPVVVIEEHFSARCSCQHRSRRHSLNLHHQCHVIFFVFSGEEWLAHVELVEDAAEGPHVDCRAVGDAEHDLWGAVETRLDVGVDFLVLEAARAEVDDFDARFIYLS